MKTQQEEGKDKKGLGDKGSKQKNQNEISNPRQDREKIVLKYREFIYCP